MAWWHTGLIPALTRQKQVELYELKDNLVCRKVQNSQDYVVRHLLTKHKQKQKQSMSTDCESNFLVNLKKLSMVIMHTSNPST